MSRSVHGGRHELGQNFLHHLPTIRTIVRLVRETEGPILEIGAGDGAITRRLARLGRDVRAVDLDEHRVRRLREHLPSVSVVHGDALRIPLYRPVVVGNLPFHLTTPILRRLLTAGDWAEAVLLTQWEVARKRAGVGGRTMLTAQTAPWFGFTLHGRVPAGGFRPKPSVDGGLFTVSRRRDPLVDPAERAGYEQFVRNVFTGRGRGIERILADVAPGPWRATLKAADIPPSALPRDLTPTQWAALWNG